MTRRFIRTIDAVEDGVNGIANRMDERGEGVARRTQLVDLEVKRLAFDRQVVEHGFTGLVGLFDDGTPLLPAPLDESVAVDLPAR